MGTRRLPLRSVNGDARRIRHRHCADLRRFPRDRKRSHTRPVLLVPGGVLSLRSQVAYVGQDVFLFRGTIRDNIAMGRPGASESEIRAAARAAYAHGFILAFPRGYDTPVGEHGAQLAGGERQRIAIARALLKDAAIILLDEATASLDSESERQVQHALEHLCRGRTTIVIAHRLHTVVDADRIFVIEDGSVVESGRHEELLRKGGRYASFYRLQLRDQEPSPRMAIASTA